MGNAVTALIGGLGRHQKASDFLDEKLVRLIDGFALLYFDGSICTLHLELYTSVCLLNFMSWLVQAELLKVTFVCP